MRRRDLITLLGGAAAWPLAARAQQLERMRRVGVQMPFAENDADAQANITAFREAFQTLGWTDSRNVRIDYRWGGGEPERISTHASELVGLKPDVILVSSPLVLQPLLQETRSIPIVFTQITDPVGSGFVASLAHPGGNVTGFAIAEFSMYGKFGTHRPPTEATSEHMKIGSLLRYAINDKGAEFRVLVAGLSGLLVFG